MRTPTNRARRAGFSLTELVAAIAVFSVVGYALAGSVDLANRAQVTVSSTIDRNVALRKAATRLRAELKSTGDARIAIATLQDQNHSLTFQVPISVAGVAGWGAFDPRLGPAEVHQNLVNGVIRYTVTVAPNNGARQLVRQVIDAGGATRRSDVLVRNLAPGGGTAPGFSLQQVGDLWQVQITQERRDGGAATTEEFHVRTRNE
ncbi:MAG: type II secretion system protein [Planctomycetota bacterium]